MTDQRKSPLIRKLSSYSHNKTTFTRLRLILGDQLNPGHSWFKNKQSDVLYVIAELPQELDYCRHHLQKACAFLAAMEAFASALTKAGHHCLHLNLDDTCEQPDLPALLLAIASHFKIEKLDYQQPDEYRLACQLDHFRESSSLELTKFSTEHFFIEDPTANQWLIKANQTMEHFYRKMRREHNILMTDQGKPEGGKWNYDHDNRNKLSSTDLEAIPKPKLFNNDVSQYIDRLNRHKVPTVGEAANPLPWPTTRKQSRALLKFFCEHQLHLFGRFQDAMTQNSEHSWSLYHSRLSFALNSKMISPREVVDTALKYCRDNPKTVELANIEGFIRQILGWREYIRLIYWQQQPNYSQLNYLEADQKLPDYFWTANTKMNCIQQVVQQTLSYSYAHHIQRLMVTGNFCLLAGIDPTEVDAWYLGVYVDALEWVEQPNTRGMSQYADGGLLATKPYAASGNYIHKMSDYCSQCHYKVSQKETDKACPLNSMYWHFLERHKQRFSENPRMALMYKQWQNKSIETRNALLERANWCLDHLEEL